MGPQRRLGIYVGFESPSIIRYLEPLTGDLFTARFADCHFDETIFPTLGGDKAGPCWNEISWNAKNLSYIDQRSNMCEQEVQKIIHLQNIANQLPDAFTDSKGVIKSHIPAVNAPARVEIPREKAENQLANESITRKRRGRPLGAKDLKPRKSRRIDTNNEKTDDSSKVEQFSNDKNAMNPENELKESDAASEGEHENASIDNHEISINFVHSKSNGIG
ncbi:uncharacterized protein LOC130590486 [Beta vulgaris subsp. vulgaris]|uniref:uncharacterized protein LOC130590486 n=1 Tax=Beta vulgaris subsp. vulgaris TaxID=3555 RepID=UPI00254962C0|nr:uncharacterized protein LOC130590486 [Beta vulgaris subsp. vulgaris]